ncbi:TonB-dependent receptor plug domain-containing protein [Solimonas variicoloris]|uniref:TonB-dependent receptor plug domain-containing protein n=1 Tax=Solimonas variicoloris TaxID=254408 RepID=UPI0005850D2E|nr:TonB-dependent receptor [Solimonas variicoloris]
MKRMVMAGAALCALSTAAQAQQDEISPFALGEIVVTAPGEGAPQAGGSEVDQAELQRFNRETVGRALSLMPGVVTGGVGARNEQAFFVRGFDLRQVPVFIDGIPVYVSYDGYADMGRFNTFDLAEIQVAKGFSSVLYGPNTLGGAVNLISRRPGAKLEGNVGGGLYYDRDMNDEGYRASVNLGSNQGLWYAQLGGSYLDRRHFSLSDAYTPTAAENGGVRGNSYNTDQKLNLKLAYTPNATDEYALNYVVQRGEKGNPPYAGSASGVSVRYWQWPSWDKDSLYFISKTAFGDAYVKVRAYYDTFRNSLFSYDDATYSTMTKRYAFKSWYDDYSYGGSLEAGTQLGAANTLKASAHYKADFHREHDNSDPVQHFEDRTYSIGVEDTQRIGARIDVVAGASYDRRDGRRAEDYGSAGISDFELGKASSFNPQLGLFYKSADDGNAYFTIARKSRFPTIKDRYSYSFGTSVPNPDLKAEYATHYQLGIAQAWHGVQIDAALYYSDISDLIQAVSIDPSRCTDSGSSCTQKQNVGDVSSQGADLGLRGRPLASLELGGNYTWLDRRNVSDDPEIRKIRLTDVPRHKLFVYGQWDATSVLSVVASAEYNADRLNTTDGRRGVPSYTVANLKLSAALGRGLSVEAGANNLFDRHYAYTEGFPEAGRNFFSNLNYRF